jgi:AcrR family transcriptional regulator
MNSVSLEGRRSFMARKKLDHDTIMDNAVKLIETKGYDHFSLRELAARLKVQPASLYNHVSGIGEIQAEVAMRAARMMHDLLTEAVSGKEDDAAFIDGVYAYRCFTEDHPELYKALIHIPPHDDEQIRKVSFFSFQPLREIVDRYGMERSVKVHFMRALRSFIHGFAELSGNGLIQRSPVSKEESFDFAVKQFLSYMKEYHHG